MPCQLPFRLHLYRMKSADVSTYQRVMLVIGWLWYKDLFGVEGRFDEMMGSNICHNLRSRIDLRVKLFLEAGKFSQ